MRTGTAPDWIHCLLYRNDRCISKIEAQRWMRPHSKANTVGEVWRPLQLNMHAKCLIENTICQGKGFSLLSINTDYQNRCELVNPLLQKSTLTRPLNASSTTLRWCKEKELSTLPWWSCALCLLEQTWVWFIFYLIVSFNGHIPKIGECGTV